MPCPNCDSTVRAFGVSINVEMKMRISLGMKAKHGGVKIKRKWFVESFEGWSLHRLTNTWRHVRQLVDRDENRYLTHVESEDGEVIKHCDGRLSDHQGYGDAKVKL